MKERWRIRAEAKNKNIEKVYALRRVLSKIIPYLYYCTFSKFLMQFPFLPPTLTTHNYTHSLYIIHVHEFTYMGHDKMWSCKKLWSDCYILLTIKLILLEILIFSWMVLYNFPFWCWSNHLLKQLTGKC